MSAPVVDCGPIWCVGECVRDATLASLAECGLPEPQCQVIDTCANAVGCCDLLHVELGVPVLERPRQKGCANLHLLPVTVTLARCATVFDPNDPVAYPAAAIEREGRMRASDRHAMRRLPGFVDECLADKLGIGCCLSTSDTGGTTYCRGGCAGTTYRLQIVLP